MIINTLTSTISFSNLTHRKKFKNKKLFLSSLSIVVCAVVVLVLLAAINRGVRFSGRDMTSRSVPILSIAQLSEAIRRPSIRPVIDLPAADLDAMTRKLRPARGMSLSSFFHTLHLFGAGVATPEDTLDGEPAPLLDVLLDVPRASALFGGSHILASTRFGIRASLYEPGLMGTDQSGSQAHRGQFLSVLGSLGVAPSRPVRLADGSTRPVSAIRDDLIANFSIDGEIAWEAVALAFYADSPELVDKYGRKFSFDAIAHELSVQKVGQASCGGTHDLIALTILLKIDQHKPILTPRARARATAYLSNRVVRVKSSQFADGSWDMQWHRDSVEGYYPVRDQSSPLSSDNALIVTGHLLEWLILLPEPLQPEYVVLERGAGWLAVSLKAASDDPSWVDQHYCPLIHATRSLRLLSRAVEPPRGD